MVVGVNLPAFLDNRLIANTASAACPLASATDVLQNPSYGEAPHP